MTRSTGATSHIATRRSPPDMALRRRVGRSSAVSTRLRLARLHRKMGRSPGRCPKGSMFPSLELTPTATDTSRAGRYWSLRELIPIGRRSSHAARRPLIGAPRRRARWSADIPPGRPAPMRAPRSMRPYVRCLRAAAFRGRPLLGGGMRGAPLLGSNMRQGPSPGGGIIGAGIMGGGIRAHRPESDIMRRAAKMRQLRPDFIGG